MQLLGATTGQSHPARLLKAQGDSEPGEQCSPHHQGLLPVTWVGMGQDFHATEIAIWLGLSRGSARSRAEQKELRVGLGLLRARLVRGWML